MLNTIREFFERNIKPVSDIPDEVSKHSLKLATAALLIEMMKADSSVEKEEQERVAGIIKSKFDLSEGEVESVMRLAEEEIWKATGYFEFTSLINKGLSYDQKIQIIEHLWEIAYADSSLDKYEEYMVRKIADLIYVSHRDFIEAKLRVRKRLKL